MSVGSEFFSNLAISMDIRSKLGNSSLLHLAFPNKIPGKYMDLVLIISSLDLEYKMVSLRVFRILIGNVGEGL